LQEKFVHFTENVHSYILFCYHKAVFQNQPSVSKTLFKILCTSNNDQQVSNSQRLIKTTPISAKAFEAILGKITGTKTAYHLPTRFGDNKFIGKVSNAQSIHACTH